jgi:hypothetical protein
MSKSSRPRYVAIGIVGALHVLILEALIHAPRQPAATEDTVWSTLFFVPPAVVQPPVSSQSKHAAALAPPQLRMPAAEVAQPITIAPDSTPPRAAVDWTSALRGTASAIASQGGAGDAAHGASPSSAFPTVHHHAYGEYSKLETGETVVWVSDHCFVVSEPPILGAANAFAHSALTHTQCERNPDSRSDLFKDLPAYKKHNEPP